MYIIMDNNIFLQSNTSQTIPTYTEIMESIPKGYSTTKSTTWRKEKKVEWRWRFFMVDNTKYVEISYLNYDEDIRIFCNRSGNWIAQEDPDFKEDLREVYYYYSNK